MTSSKNFLPTVLSGICLLLCNPIFANDKVITTCPGVDEIAQFDYVASFPYQYNYHSNKLAISALAANLTEDPNNSNASGWAIFIHPLEIGQSDSEKLVVKETLANLNLVTPIPFQYNVFDDIRIPVCVYHLHGHKEVSIMAYYINDHIHQFDDENNNIKNIKSKVDQQRARIINLAKNIKGLLN